MKGEIWTSSPERVNPQSEEAKTIANLREQNALCEQENDSLRRCLQWCIPRLAAGYAEMLRQMVTDNSAPDETDHIAAERDEMRNVMFEIIAMVEPSVDRPLVIPEKFAARLSALFNRVRHFEPTPTLRKGE